MDGSKRPTKKGSLSRNIKKKSGGQKFWQFLDARLCQFFFGSTFGKAQQFGSTDYYVIFIFQNFHCYRIQFDSVPQAQIRIRQNFPSTSPPQVPENNLKKIILSILELQNMT